MAAAPGPHHPSAPGAPGGPEPAGPAPGGGPTACGPPPPGRPLVAVDVSGLPAAADGDLLGGLGAVAALARLRLAARRTGHRVRLRGASPELRALVESAGLGGEFEWEAEEREEMRGVEE